MSWFRFSSVVFGFWAILFALLPRFTNEFAALHYTTSAHAEDWTRLAGVLSLGYSVLLHQAHKSFSGEVRRIVALTLLITTVLCALLMTVWQLLPDPRWIRLDILNIALLGLMAFGMASELPRPCAGHSTARAALGSFVTRTPSRVSQPTSPGCSRGCGRRTESP